MKRGHPDQFEINVTWCNDWLRRKAVSRDAKQIKHFVDLRPRPIDVLYARSIANTSYSTHEN
jgi:hypothetical protein